MRLFHFAFPFGRRKPPPDAKSAAPFPGRPSLPSGLTLPPGFPHLDQPPEHASANPPPPQEKPPPQEEPEQPPPQQVSDRLEKREKIR